MIKLPRFILLILLALSMLLSTACGGKDKKKTDFIYEISDDEAVITGYSGLESELVIPSELGGKPVTKIAENAFKGMVGLTKVTIPDSVTVIDYAFSECPDLTDVILGSGVISMNGAFKDCKKLASVSGGENAAQLSEAFMNCEALEKGYIPKTAENCISTFRGCKALKSVTIEEGVTSLPYTFEGCTSITEINLPAGVSQALRTFENCTSLILVTGCQSLTELESTFAGCTALSYLSLGNGVKTLKGAFINCPALTKIENLPTEVESYSPSFTGCVSLREIVIPKMAEGEAATYDLTKDVQGCTALEKLTVNSSFFVTGEFCTTFAGCTSLKEITIPDEEAKALLRVDAMYTDTLFTGKNTKVTNAVNKYKKASNVRITPSFGFIGETSYTQIYGGDVNYFSYETVAASKSVVGFESFTQSYYWCGYPNGTNRKNTTVAIERTYTFYLRVTGGNDGTLPSAVTVNGMECVIEDN